MSTAKMILKLSEASGISGMETGAVEAAKNMLAGLGECSVTALGSLLCKVKSASPDKPHIMLTAHIDEIGLIVTYIDDDGFLRVGNCGGIDRSMLLAAQVIVHTADGTLSGVVCTIPPHLNPDDTKVPKVEDIYIDVGMDAAAAREKIALGDRVSFVSEAQEMLGGKVCAKSIDDRGGCVSVILAAKQLAQAKLDCSVTVALTSMEEVGGQGAKTAAYQLMPAHAIAVDVSYGHTPDAARHKCGVVGEGPMLGISPILDNGMFAQMKASAKRHEIPYQLEVMGGNTGTDADEIATTGAGVRCALLSIPLRYMHTPIEIVAVSDVEAVANLIAAYVTDEFGGER
ncbi:M20/M25/M40 family metallo-hydrolase [Oscillospiraceae bacterium PP1C4]